MGLPFCYKNGGDESRLSLTRPGMVLLTSQPWCQFGFKQWFSSLVMLRITWELSWGACLEVPAGECSCLCILQWRMVLLHPGRSSSSSECTASRKHMEQWGREGAPAYPARSVESTLVINRVCHLAAGSLSHLTWVSNRTTGHVATWSNLPVILICCQDSIRARMAFMKFELNSLNLCVCDYRGQEVRTSSTSPTHPSLAAHSRIRKHHPKCQNLELPRPATSESLELGVDFTLHLWHKGAGLTGPWQTFHFQSMWFHKRSLWKTKR